MTTSRPIGPPHEADINHWVIGESVSNQDAVVWYSAHFSHDVDHHGAAQHGHIMGPT